jgi:hypothetical protein
VIYLGACRSVSPPDCVPCGGCSACTALYVAEAGNWTSGFTNVQNLTSITGADWHTSFTFGPSCDGISIGMTDVDGVSLTITLPAGITPQKLCGAWDFNEVENEWAACGGGVDLSGLAVVVDGQDVTVSAASLAMMCDYSSTYTSSLIVILDALSDTYGQVILRIVITFVDDTASDGALIALFVCE